MVADPRDGPDEVVLRWCFWTGFVSSALLLPVGFLVMRSFGWVVHMDRTWLGIVTVAWFVWWACAVEEAREGW